MDLQDIHSLEDEPRRKVMIELRRRHFPDPLGRDRRGTRQGVENLTIDAIREQHAKCFQPGSVILSVAGNIDWSTLREQVERLFGDWKGDEVVDASLTTSEGGMAHLDKETTQTHIALAYPSVTFGSAEYYTAQGAVQVLSGGMSARLFTEVREKRGLCYAVAASYQSFKQVGCVLCYAGTTNERAPETLEVTLDELHRLKDGVTDEEVARVKAGLKSSLIMQEESTSARAGALASDWYFLGRVRPLEEIQEAVDSLTAARIVEHAKAHPPENFTLVTLGPNPLNVPDRYQPHLSAAST